MRWLGGRQRVRKEKKMASERAKQSFWFFCTRHTNWSKSFQTIIVKSGLYLINLVKFCLTDYNYYIITWSTIKSKGFSQSSKLKL